MNETATLPTHPLHFDLNRVPADVVALPEPARQAAIDAIQRMLEGGASFDDAVDKARAIASDWISQRAPGDQSEVKTDLPAIPDREEVLSFDLRPTTKMRRGNASRS